MESDDPRRERPVPGRPAGSGAGGGEPGRGMEQDPTRKLLKVFGVKVTDYESRTDALLQRSAAGDADRVALLEEAIELTADLDHWLREVTSHVLERQEQVLKRLRQPGSA